MTHRNRLGLLATAATMALALSTCGGAADERLCSP